MEYNRRYHEGIAQSPLERYLSGPEVSRPSPENQMIELAFTVAETRIQRQSDGTIQLKGKRFEIPSRFRHLKKLHIRYQSWDLRTVNLVDPNTDHLLAKVYPQDKIKNANGFRRVLQLEQEAFTAKPVTDPVPPLLRKLLSDYAATGLPPAYIPKEEYQEKDNRRNIHAKE
jgi:hypothetical protein